jgi:hypothetical protein
MSGPHLEANVLPRVRQAPGFMRLESVDVFQVRART